MPRSAANRGALTSARSKARRGALDLLFESEQRGLNAGTLLEHRLATPVGEHPLRPYTVDIVRGVVERWTAVNDLISTYSQGWALERMPAVDRAILRIATWEIMHNDEVPDGVAVSEAVELATALSTDDSPSFVNGLLSRIAEVKQSPPDAAAGELGPTAEPSQEPSPEPTAEPSPDESEAPA